ncbi:MAG: DUF2935 domain-containing protein [Bacillota bacterium]
MTENSRYRVPPCDMARENMFWLRLFRDHSQFLMETLTPGQTGLIAQAQHFYQMFDRLLGQAEEVSGPFLQEAARVVLEFRSYKLGIVNLQLAGQVPVNLPPGALNEMLDEDDEYLRLLNVIPGALQMSEAAFLLHQHLLWLPNNAAHAALTSAQLDPGEASLKEIYNRYSKLFHKLADKVMELKGLMRDNPRMVPSLVYTNAESAGLTQEFRHSLENYRELRATAQVLAISPALLLDHFNREASYYLEKIGCGKA